MDVPLNTDVFCLDGLCGRSMAVVINPVSKEITHLVVATKEMLHSEYLVPVNLIEFSQPDQIQLRINRNKLATLDPFHRVKFVSLRDLDESSRSLAEIPEAQLSSAWLWPYITAEGEFGTYEDVEQIPHHELAVNRGGQVVALDGVVGQVDEFIINPENDNITHLVMREGHFWGQKEVTIPISEIERVESDLIYLKLRKEDIEKLPAVPVRRWWR